MTENFGVYWDQYQPLPTKIGLFQSISRHSPILAQNDWTIIHLQIKMDGAAEMDTVFVINGGKLWNLAYLSACLS